MESPQTEKFTCPCCGYKTYYHKPNGSYGICAVCFWEDDPIQLTNPDYEGGANGVSLKQAQKNFVEFGASRVNMKLHVRNATKEEPKDENWKPFG